MSPTPGQLGLKAYDLMQKHPGLSQKQAAELVGVSRSAVSRVQQMHDRGAVPQLVQAVRDGLIPVNTAADLALTPPRNQRMLMSKLRSEPVPTGFAGSLTPAQIRRAMAQFIGFDAVRGEFTADLLAEVPAAELASFEDRLRASRRAIDSLVNDIKKINEQRTSS
jgi:transcriptional regulator with XRE-family HTH domain